MHWAAEAHSDAMPQLKCCRNQDILPPPATPTETQVIPGLDSNSSPVALKVAGIAATGIQSIVAVACDNTCCAKFATYQYKSAIGSGTATEKEITCALEAGAVWSAAHWAKDTLVTYTGAIKNWVSSKNSMVRQQFP